MTTPLAGSDRLIIFMRYPVAGQAKTRLIPALGARGAADLHRQMAEHTIAQARKLQQLMVVTIEVCFTDADIAQMQAWLGADLSYQAQQGDDLGDRMAQAFHAAFLADCQAVVIIGTDCPDVDATLLMSAFQQLQHHDLVMGPAVDGGYYLIGLRRAIPELFKGITWSTSEVFAQTIAIAQTQALRIAQLPVQADVDYPADLVVWQAATTPISLIIPVFNEAARLAQTLVAAQTGSYTEIIVVDGGSTDTSVEIAKSLGVRVVSAETGRAAQMNAGAAIALKPSASQKSATKSFATGEILLFLHGDTRLPLGFDRSIRQTLALPGVVAGAFNLKIEGDSIGLRLVEWGVRQRSRYCQLPYGDQALFLKAATFRELGGFPALPIMEDFVFVQQLNRLGKVAIAPAAVLTSSRRWQKLGILKTTLINQLMILGYFLGISPTRLARWYRRNKI